MIDTKFLLFPIHYQRSVFPFSVTLVCLLTLLSISLIIDLFYRSDSSNRPYFALMVFEIIKTPFLVLLLCFATYAACDLTQLYYPHTFDFNDRFTISFLLSLIEAFVFCWIIFRAIKVTRKLYLRSSSEN